MKMTIAYLKKNTASLAVGLLIIFYMVGLTGMFYQPTKPIIISLIPFTILMNFVLMMAFHRPWTGKFAIASLLIMIIGFFIEVVGVQTGIIFGGYTYGSNMGIKILQTPLLIGVNWLFVVYTTYILLKKLHLNIVIKSITGGLLLVLYDILLEPFAMAYDMWDWAGGTVPLQNYIAWFIISFLFLTMFYLFKIKAANKLAIPVILIQSVFFIILFLAGY